MSPDSENALQNVMRHRLSIGRPDLALSELDARSARSGEPTSATTWLLATTAALRCHGQGKQSCRYYGKMREADDCTRAMDGEYHRELALDVARKGDHNYAMQLLDISDRYLVGRSDLLELNQYARDHILEDARSAWANWVRRFPLRIVSPALRGRMRIAR